MFFSFSTREEGYFIPIVTNSSYTYYIYITADSELNSLHCCNGIAVYSICRIHKNIVIPICSIENHNNPFIPHNLVVYISLYCAQTSAFSYTRTVVYNNYECLCSISRYIIINCYAFKYITWHVIVVVNHFLPHLIIYSNSNFRNLFNKRVHLKTIFVNTI